MPKIFIDFEYTREHQNTTPVSLGIVTEDGNHQFYAEFTDYDQSQVDDWLKQNVMNNLSLLDKPENYVHRTNNMTEIKGSVPYVINTSEGLSDWIKNLNYSSITVASFGFLYDGMLFKELFKTAQTKPPNNLRHFGYDVATMLQEYGVDPNINGVKEQFIGIEDSSQKHNALFDAHVVQKIYLKLKKES